VNKLDRKTEISDHFMHAGAGTSMVLAWAGLIPGVIPLLALAAVVTVVAVLPFLVLGVVAAVVAAPPYAAWRFMGWGRRRRRRHNQPERATVAPAVPPPYSGVC
jgi:hypothetical protein